MMELEVVVHGDGRTGVRVIGGDAVIVPTTTELLDYVGDVEKEEKIQKLQVECLQKADEKVEIARQAHDMIDATVRRLDADLAAMEKILQVILCAAFSRSNWVMYLVLTYRVHFSQVEISKRGRWPSRTIWRPAKFPPAPSGFWPRFCTTIPQLACTNLRMRTRRLTGVRTLVSTTLECHSCHCRTNRLYSLQPSRVTSCSLWCGQTQSGRCDLCCLSRHDFVLSGHGCSSAPED